MECNKDEALRAKAIAEMKLSAKDFNGAKKFTLKAQTLYPGLDGIAQMLTTLDVYISAENKVGGEVDWYGILGVKPSDDDETIRKSYRKLALMLHPDKNKSVGADGAFKLLSEAWSLLSDKAKRLAYNQRRNVKGFNVKVPSQSGGGPSAPPAANGVYSFAKRATSKPKSSTTTAAASTRMGQGSVPPAGRPTPPPSPVVHQRSDTFWTICHRCKMHYEYLKLYLNHTLLCPNCHEPFLAKEMPPPVNLPKSTQSPVGRSTTTSTQKSGKFDNNKSNLHWGPSSRTNVTRSTEPSIATKAASVIQQANDRLKRDREEFYAAWPSKKRKADDEAQSSNVKIPFQMSTGNGGNLSSRGSGFSNKVNRTRELLPSETRNMLMHKAQSEIRKKLIELDSEEKEKEKEKVNNETQKKSVEPTEEDIEQERQESAMNVPDPDFHDFDLDRTEDSFGDNQVWAAYDDDDGMPRFYAIIHKVLSRKPLKMKISWLNSKTTSEFGSSDWLAYGFRKSCGEFRVGRHEVNKSLNSFSQKVEYIKAKGIIYILPRKGQVWAVYRNWSPDWNETTPEDVIHKYDMVEVLNDYSEEEGVSVTHLVKYAGFRTVFHARSEESEVTVIPKEEMFRFSHQVPKYVLNGEEGDNAPKGCLELDPAATPLDLIQSAVATEESNEEIENGEEEEGNKKQK